MTQLLPLLSLPKFPALFPPVIILSIKHMQGDIDWGRDAWMSAATGSSCLGSSQQETKAAVMPHPDNTSLTSPLDHSKLTALWADSAGLLILYFTCVMPSKQVQQRVPAELARDALSICLAHFGLQPLHAQT